METPRHCSLALGLACGLEEAMGSGSQGCLSTWNVTSGVDFCEACPCSRVFHSEAEEWDCTGLP